MDLKRGIDKAVEKVVDSLSAQSQTIGNDKNKIEQVASISANNDNNIGKLIAQAFGKVGKGRCHHGRRGQGYRYDRRSSRRHAI